MKAWTNLLIILMPLCGSAAEADYSVVNKTFEYHLPVIKPEDRGAEKLPGVSNVYRATRIGMDKDADVYLTYDLPVELNVYNIRCTTNSNSNSNSNSNIVAATGKWTGVTFTDIYYTPVEAKCGITVHTYDNHTYEYDSYADLYTEAVRRIEIKVQGYLGGGA